ncbi:MAG TPA: hypothetical protein VMK65_10755 [Longimicrobiales bacterium]|nr:hypothetical protein [Longimicrobiales bacterium]
MRKELTPLERTIFDYLVAYLRKNTYQPSIREIGREFDIKSTKTVAEHLQSIADKGWIERDPSRSRGVKLIGTEVYPRVLHVPCYEQLPEGDDPFATPAPARYAMDPDLAGVADAVFLRMPDDSLEGDGVRAGDLLLVERAGAEALDGGGLLVCRARGAGAVRHVRGGASGYVLESSSPDHAPLRAGRSDLAVFGRVVGVFRHMGKGNAAGGKPTLTLAPIPG